MISIITLILASLCGISTWFFFPPVAFLWDSAMELFGEGCMLLLFIVLPLISVVICCRCFYVAVRKKAAPYLIPAVINLILVCLTVGMYMIAFLDGTSWLS